MLSLAFVITRGRFLDGLVHSVKFLLSSLLNTLDFACGSFSLYSGKDLRFVRFGYFGSC